ncbi:hypothetical protein [Sphingorhabdus sp.]|uniref:hypothetical protein n=1 Tax=Sphingorhabdus sp. TaxID=1902408 RepID=UPI003593234F
MTDTAPPTSLHLKENLKGRIDNLAMSPSYANTLIPVFEALMNSIHSVQERFGDDWVTRGSINLTVDCDSEGNPESFVITDNGVGLNDDNFESFRTYDSRLKAKKGGKGVGRLTWLKVFEGVKIISKFELPAGVSQRSFDFVLDNEKAFQNYALRKLDTKPELQTRVELRALKDGYRSHCPKRLETITHRIAAHFLPFLIGDQCPDITVSSATENHSLRQIIEAHTHNPQSLSVDVQDVGNFTIKHLLLNKALVEGGTEHTVYLAAHDRIVTDHGINNQTGLDSAFNFEDEQVFYVGIVSSEFLDNSVTQERNNFDIPKATMKQITKAAEEAAKVYLADPINSLIDAKAQTIERVVTNFPRYSYLVQDRKEFARELPLNSKTEEAIYQAMSVYDYRETRDLRRDLNALVSAESEPTQTAEFKQKLDQVMERVGEQERASLAEYVSKRKLIIDLLEHRLGFEDKEKQRLYTEEAVHKVICPLKVNSGDIEYGNHNLWLIDDRLAYYDFWASDQQIRKYAKSSECADRPDLILFQGSNLLQREGTDQPIVIVEFKRPARTEYSDDENPIKQIYDYIRELREHKVTDNNGKLITQIGADTPFFCYLICDITPRLKAILEDYKINQTLPGGRGFFGYNDTRRAYVEVLQYGQIVKDARLRHEAFFKELGIN